MKQRLFKSDALTLGLAALLAIAAVWLIVDLVLGSTNQLEDRFFSFALGINIGNAIRIVSPTSRRADQVP